MPRSSTRSDPGQWDLRDRLLPRPPGGSARVERPSALQHVRIGAAPATAASPAGSSASLWGNSGSTRSSVQAPPPSEASGTSSIASYYVRQNLLRELDLPSSAGEQSVLAADASLQARIFVRRAKYVVWWVARAVDVGILSATWDATCDRDLRGLLLAALSGEICFLVWERLRKEDSPIALFSAALFTFRLSWLLGAFITIHGSSDCQDASPLAFQWLIIVMVCFTGLLMMRVILVVSIVFFLPQTLHAAETALPKSMGLPEQIESRIVVSTAHILDDGDTVCPICTQEHAPGDQIAFLPCEHHFHFSCLKRWLAIVRLCPVCGESVFDMEPFDP